MILDSVEPPVAPSCHLDPAGTRSPAGPPAPRAKPRVLLVFRSEFAESSTMLNGIAHYLHSSDPWAVFVDHRARAETDTEWLLQQDWDGVISRHTGPALVQACAERRIPLVDLNDSPPFLGVPKIRPDNLEIGRLGATYLLDRGFRHFAFAGLAHDGWARERRQGFVDTLREQGFACELFEPDDAPALTPFANNQQTQALAGWLQGLPHPLAVMGCHDARALQVLEAARSIGLLIPEEIAVLGANNDAAYCELALPPLSSVATNPFLSGYHAAGQLAALMAGFAATAHDERVAPVRVISRRSTDVLAIPDRHVAAALRYIREHACEGINVDEILPHAAVSRSQLEKKFRSYLGRSPQAEIRRVQVTRIRQLLAETDYPLKKIAELSGFDYMEYMCVVFRRLTGETLGAYRKKTQFAGRPISTASGG